MREIITNQRFDDIYFSPDDGMAETEHVFIGGNNLRVRWQKKAPAQKEFTIFEAGFGTGLNFLCAAKAFDECADDKVRLHYIAAEKYPLSPSRIERALSPWNDTLDQYLKRMLGLYPLRIQTTHRIDFMPNISLTLLFGDINNILPNLSVPMGIDAWFLDGFAPSKNPQMWTQILFENMARLSKPNATIATFTAAGAVRRGLSENGFEVQKVKGFGRKREMIKGRFIAREDVPEKKFKQQQPKQKIAIIGGGLAGMSCAYLLKSAGHECTVFEKNETLASGTSGNIIGLYNPRFFADDIPQARFYAAAFAKAYEVFSVLKERDHNIAFDPCGALHLINSPEKKKRFDKMINNGIWHKDHMHIVDKNTATDIAGVDIENDCLYLPQSGAVSPKALCENYADGVNIVFGKESAPEKTKMGWSVDGQLFDIVIMAGGADSLSLEVSKNLPLHTVRGQITYLKTEPKESYHSVALCYGGYVSPPMGDGHIVVGSSFQKWRDDIDIDQQDNEDNLNKLSQNIPSLSKRMGNDAKIIDARAGLRIVAKDHLPVIGAVSGYDDLYISTAHGSHGILSSLMGAVILRDLIEYGAFIGDSEIARSVAPDRFA